MNAELKALLGLIFDGLNLGEQILLGKNVVLALPQLLKILQDVPSVISNLGHLPAELETLHQSEDQQDLVDFIQATVAGSGVSADVQKVVSASLALLQSVVGGVTTLVHAIQGKPALKGAAMYETATYRLPRKAKWAPGSYSKYAESPFVQEAHELAQSAHKAAAANAEILKELVEKQQELKMHKAAKAEKKRTEP